MKIGAKLWMGAKNLIQKLKFTYKNTFFESESRVTKGLCQIFEQDFETIFVSLFLIYLQIPSLHPDWQGLLVIEAFPWGEQL
jgi:hypothetical protein